MKILTNDFLPVTCGLCLFAGDIPRFGCGSAALGNSRGECFLLRAGYRRPPRVPVRRALVSTSGIQNRLIREPGANQLHTDRHAFGIYPAGQRAARQAEHAREAQEIGVIVARAARVVGVALDTVRK